MIDFFSSSIEENLLIAVLIIIIFVILFEILYKLNLFKNKILVAIISLSITFLSLYSGFTKKIAIKILQITTSGFVIGLGILLAIIFIIFLITSITGKKIKIRKIGKK